MTGQRLALAIPRQHFCQRWALQPCYKLAEHSFSCCCSRPVLPPHIPMSTHINALRISTSQTLLRSPLLTRLQGHWSPCTATCSTALVEPTSRPAMAESLADKPNNSSTAPSYWLCSLEGKTLATHQMTAWQKLYLLAKSAICPSDKYVLGVRKALSLGRRAEGHLIESVIKL